MQDKVKEPLFTKKDVMYYIILAIIIIACRLFIFSPVLVRGESMMPNLENNQLLIASIQSEVERFDIVTFPSPVEPEKKYIKRVIGLPGDNIRIEDDQLYINDKAIDEPYLEDYKKELEAGEQLTADYDMTVATGVKKVPEGEYLVMGDNRDHSFDGRSFGFISREEIKGIAKYTLWPVKSFGSIEKGK